MTAPQMQTALPSRDVVVIGGSSGSLRPLRNILTALPSSFPASLLIVVHGSRGDRTTLDAFGSQVPIRIELAEDGATLRPATAYLGRPDLHLIAMPDGLRVLRGPRENNARPSIDVLFRSAAVTYGSRVIGVILSGSLSDGAYGLRAVARCGGVTVVQNPSEANVPELPEHALRATAADYTVSEAEIPKVLQSLVREPAAQATPVPDDLALEARFSALSMEDPRQVSSLGPPAHVSCPECGGPLTHVGAGPTEKFHCDVGHAFGFGSLLAGQSRSLERALWLAYRTLRERVLLLSRLADDARSRGQASSAQNFELKVRELNEHANALHRAIAGNWNITAEGAEQIYCDTAADE